MALKKGLPYSVKWRQKGGIKWFHLDEFKHTGATFAQADEAVARLTREHPDREYGIIEHRGLLNRKYRPRNTLVL